MRPRLIIMAKAPIMGQAKTRLAADIGVVHAKRVYRAMMSQVIRQTSDPRWETVLAVTPTQYLGQVPEWTDIPQTPQVSGSLSPRLAAVFNRKAPTICIGTDCPQVTAKDIADGFQALRSHEAVFGPADDGGFWLIGLNGPARRGLFEDVRWSTEHTLLDMADKFDDIGVLRTLTDVDDLSALRSVENSRKNT